MSTSRKYHVFSHPSRILPRLFYASVTNYSKTRIVYETGLYDSRKFAESAAKKWAEQSRSAKAKSLEGLRG